MIRSRRVLSIRWTVTAVAVVLTAAAVMSVGAIAERHTRQALTKELESRLTLEARNLALTSAGVLLEDYPELTLHPLLKEKLARQPELASAVVVDHEGKIQGHADPQKLGTVYEPRTGLTAVADPSDGSSALAAGVSLWRGPGTLVAIAPIEHASGKTLGTVVVGMRLEYLEDVIARSRRQQAILLAIFLVVGVATSFLLVSHLLRPLATLRAGIERIAGGDLVTPVRVQDRTELGLLAEAINGMAGGLRRAQEVRLERERLSHEMDLAREMQRSLLPSRRIDAGAFVIEGSQQAAAEVGGDSFDYFALPDGRIGVAIADVSGKGLAGCLVMSILYSVVRAWRGTYRSPAELLIALDAHLVETLQPGAFITMWYGILDPASGTVTYASAGHNPTLIYRAGEERVETRRTRGIPLAAIRGGAIRATLADERITLEPGDLILQYTDGLNEAFDPAGREQFGFVRMASVLRETAPRGVTSVIARLMGDVRAWIGEGAVLDDQTVLAIQRQVAPVSERAASQGWPPSTGEVPSERDRAALACLADARDRGVRLEVDGRSDLLAVIRAWVDATPAFRGIRGPERELLTTALYEVSANILEHGYGGDPAARLDLWWIPGGDAPRFVVLDHGAPFSANDWKGKDLQSPAVRRHGRGLGLEIIHRAMRDVSYHPGTPEGNLTCMTFVGSPASSKEVRHVG